ncbi:MAG TPA: EAL domain-containing protein [Burkholderiales bacterium]|nr:EAL domain-containing protein [Burkholderiales bacterium]
MNEGDKIKAAVEAAPASGYAGRTRFTQLEYEAVLANASVGIAFTRDRRFFLCNPKFAEMFGWKPDELIGEEGEVIYPSRESFDELGRIAVPVLSAGRRLELEWELQRKDGSLFPCHLIAKAINEHNLQQGTVWIAQDITDRHHQRDELERALREQEAILNATSIGIAFVKERRFARCNRRFEELFGYAPGELIGQSSATLAVTTEEFEQFAADALPRLASGETVVSERRARRKDGTPLWCKITGRAVDPHMVEQGVIWICEDIGEQRAARESLEAARAQLERAVVDRTTALQSMNHVLEAEIGERKLAELRAQYLADHDVLTNLPNRRLLEDRLTQALALSERNRKQTAVMFIDLDRFKAVNDTAGHAAGDAVLKEVSQRLAKQLRTGDTICRIGGDEFVVVLPQFTRLSDLAHVSQKIIETVSQPVTVDERDLQVSPSIGISIFPDDGHDAETLIRNADAAMYHAKETGRANYQFFTEQMNLAATRRVQLENDLRSSLQNQELRMFYQPVVEIATGRIVGYEGLLRWQHRSRGLISPGDFIQLAEDTGLILRIGDWVLGAVCRWGALSPAASGMTVGVNLSARQFADPKLVDIVARALQDSGLPPGRLELEVSEGTAMQHSEPAMQTLRKLKELGVTLVIDDFGTSYTSLVNLKRYPVDKLKIDKSLIGSIPDDADSGEIVVAVVDLAHALGLKVVAEGVETEAQEKLLREAGCDYMQGFRPGEPMDPQAAEKKPA